ncbi:DedA family protein [Aquibium microcysteis]|uniref:DedA family protein n=1 Tax=Aquibium microcysteis TaxID=675281 RepID=UPI00165D1BC7|nr:DedA family protein [Aquibium microcysteis]
MSETIHGLIEQYGVAAVFLGSMAEGETAAVLGGFFAHQALFPVWQVLVAAGAGSFFGDLVFFVIGRRFADHPRVERLRSTAGFGKALAWIERHPDLFVFASRFLYGFRTAGGVAAGLSSIGTGRFLVLNAVSAAVWAIVFAGGGYVFGLGAQRLLGEEIARHERLLVALAIGVVTLVAARFLVVRYRPAWISAARARRLPGRGSAE